MTRDEVQYINHSRLSYSEAFDRIIKPILQQEWGYSQVINLEDHNNEALKVLDIVAGADAILATPWGLRLAGVRIQEGKSFDTFTIRSKREGAQTTQLDKIITAKNNNCLYPYYQIQAYINNGRLLSIAISTTDDLLAAIRQKKCKLKKTGTAQVGQSWFYSIKWSELQEMGAKINIYKPLD